MLAPLLQQECKVLAHGVFVLLTPLLQQECKVLAHGVFVLLTPLLQQECKVLACGAACVAQCAKTLHFTKLLQYVTLCVLQFCSATKQSKRYAKHATAAIIPSTRRQRA
jgi:hypothetical protein